MQDGQSASVTFHIFLTDISFSKWPESLPRISPSHFPPFLDLPLPPTAALGAQSLQHLSLTPPVALGATSLSQNLSHNLSLYRQFF